MEAIPMETQEVTEQQQLSKTIDTLIAEMKAMTITTQEQYDFVNGWLKKNKDTQKIVTEFFEPDRVEAKRKYDDILANKNAFIKPLETAEKVARDKMTVFATEQEKKRREEAKIEEDRRRKEIEDDRIAKAEELSAMGRSEKADEVLDKKVVVAKSTIQTETQKVGKTIEVWTVSVDDKAKFVAEAFGFPALLGCISVDTVALAKLAKENPSFVRGIGGLVVNQTFRPVL